MLTAEQRPNTDSSGEQGATVTRRHIVDASRHLFATRGYSRTTVRDIARQAGISDAAIYYHFHTKGDVLQALIDEDLDAPAEAEPTCGQTPSPGDVIYDRLVHTTRLIEKNRELLTIILREALSENPHAVYRYRRLVDGWERSLARALADSLPLGLLGRESVRSVARQVVYITIMALQDTLVLSRAPARDAETRRDRMLASLRRSLGWLLPTCAARSQPGPA